MNLEQSLFCIVDIFCYIVFTSLFRVLELCDWGRSGSFTTKLTLLLCFLGGLNEWIEIIWFYILMISLQNCNFWNNFAHAHGRHQKTDQCKNPGPRQRSKFRSLLIDLWGSFFYFIGQIPLSNEVFPPSVKKILSYNNFRKKSLAITFNFSRKQIERLMGKSSLVVFCPENILPPLPPKSHPLVSISLKLLWHTLSPWRDAVTQDPSMWDLLIIWRRRKTGRCLLISQYEMNCLRSSHWFTTMNYDTEKKWVLGVPLSSFPSTARIFEI